MEHPEKEKPLNEDPQLAEQIAQEAAKLKTNAESLQTELAQAGDAKELEDKLGKEGVDKLASNTRKIILGAAALLAIPFVADMVSPGILAEWKEAANNFLDQNFIAIAAGLTAALSVLGGVVFWQDYKDWRKAKEEQKKE